MRIVLFLVLLLATPKAWAHPHAFIDLQTTIIYDATGQIIALHHYWLFDQFYTEFALHDFGYKKDGALDPDKLMELAHENLQGLKDFDYFTVFDGDKPGFGTPTDIMSTLEKERIAMRFTLPLAKPLDPNKQAVSFRIYDPSYYTAMLHVKSAPLDTQGTQPSGCAATLERPNPTLAFKTMAAALDRNATAPDDLGSYFAEKVSISCH